MPRDIALKDFVQVARGFEKSSGVAISFTITVGRLSGNLRYDERSSQDYVAAFVKALNEAAQEPAKPARRAKQ